MRCGMERRNNSIADQIFEILERDILSEKFPRGEVLTENRLSELLEVSRSAEESGTLPQGMDETERQLAIENLEEQMLSAAEALDFEKAAKLRDRLLALRGEAPMNTEQTSRKGRLRRRKK